VDPLDGTVNFLFGIPQWCVSVAVQDGESTTVAGAIFDPNRDEMWAAMRGGEATLNGTALSASQRSELSTAMVATGLYYDAGVRSEQARVLANLVPRVRDIRRMGSAALDMTWTAAGRYDAYFERGTKLWDVAAGALICERAGLRVVDLIAHDHLPPGLLVAPAGLVDPLLELVS
jgi:myo-inositol-1(or 4)-monophosphatase